MWLPSSCSTPLQAQPGADGRVQWCQHAGRSRQPVGARRGQPPPPPPGQAAVRAGGLTDKAATSAAAGAPEVADGLIQGAQLLVHHAARVEGIYVSGLDGQGCAIIRQRLLQGACSRRPWQPASRPRCQPARLVGAAGPCAAAQALQQHDHRSSARGRSGGGRAPAAAATPATKCWRGRNARGSRRMQFLPFLPAWRRQRLPRSTGMSSSRRSRGGHLSSGRWRPG